MIPFPLIKWKACLYDIQHLAYQCVVMNQCLPVAVASLHVRS